MSTKAKLTAYVDPVVESTLEELIGEADRALYEQKRKKQRL